MFFNAISITDQEFEIFRKLIYNLLGISLSDKKRSLVISRLGGRIRKLGLNSFTEYLHYIDRSQNALEELVVLANKITTNETSFFREKHHFEYMVRTALPYLAKNLPSGMPIRIWSSACSSGEEPYTIALICCEFFQDRNRAKILATDVNTEVLNRAKQGIYAMAPFKKSVDKQYHKYFTQIDSDLVKVRDDVKRMITFKRLNLNKDIFPIKSPLDFIFCRNVMIYFDGDTKKNLVERFYQYLKDDGLLFVGHSENLMSITNKFKLVDKTIYRKIV